MKRGLLGLAVLAALVGCARPGSRPDTTNVQSSPAQPMPTLAACVRASGPATAGPTYSAPAPPPQPTRSLSAEEEWQRRQAENKAFRQRRPLPAAVVAANRPCADAVRAGLERLRTQQRFDAAAIEQVLADVGLDDAIARKAGRLDAGGASGGLLFAGSTGQACVFGEHGPNATTVELGSVIADGGCLPAPD